MQQKWYNWKTKLIACKKVSLNVLFDKGDQNSPSNESCGLFKNETIKL